MSNKWDNDYFVRVPKEMFNDMVWNSKPFSKSKAYAHLYSMAHDGPKSTIIENSFIIHKDDMTLELKNYLSSNNISYKINRGNNICTINSYKRF